MHITALSRMEIAAAQRALMGKIEALKQLQGWLIALDNPRLETDEPKIPASPVDHVLHGGTPAALAPIVGFPNAHTNLREAIAPIDGV